MHSTEFRISNVNGCLKFIQLYCLSGVIQIAHRVTSQLHAQIDAPLCSSTCYSLHGLLLKFKKGPISDMSDSNNLHHAPLYLINDYFPQMAFGYGQHSLVCLHTRCQLLIFHLWTTIRMHGSFHTAETEAGFVDILHKKTWFPNMYMKIKVVINILLRLQCFVVYFGLQYKGKVSTRAW